MVGIHTKQQEKKGHIIKRFKNTLGRTSESPKWQKHSKKQEMAHRAEQPKPKIAAHGGRNKQEGQNRKKKKDLVRVLIAGSPW